MAWIRVSLPHVEKGLLPRGQTLLDLSKNLSPKRHALWIIFMIKQKPKIRGKKLVNLTPTQTSCLLNLVKSQLIPKTKL